jgi:ribonuclease D
MRMPGVGKELKIVECVDDLPDASMEDAESVAVDTEAMGLLLHRDRLCLAQFSRGDGVCFLVRFNCFDKAANIRNLLVNQRVTKIFHYARFDMAAFYKYLGVVTQNVYCTKIASKLVRTYTSKHGLADICRELLGVDVPKEQTCTDWGKQNLTRWQLEYAARDVAYLHELKDKLDSLLKRERKEAIAKDCFNFLGTRVILDLIVGESYDIFSHAS